MNDFTAKLISNGGVVYHSMGNSADRLQLLMLIMLEKEANETTGMIINNKSGSVVYQCKKSAY